MAGRTYYAAPFSSDINLERETPLVFRRQQRAIRRVYSAKIDGRTSSVTVAVYQDDDAREVDRTRFFTRTGNRILPSTSLCGQRMPLAIRQLWGTASSGNIHAAIFNDVYIYAYAVNRRTLASPEFLLICPQKMDLSRWLIDKDCTFFIRRSTGLLCVDLTPGGFELNRPPWFEGRTGVIYLSNTANLMAEVPKWDESGVTTCWTLRDAQFQSTGLRRVIIFFYPTFRPTTLPALGHGLTGPQPLDLAREKSVFAAL
ncbi:hypothetical protein C8R45DRAFT_1072530 [Mycena sanguinolenta]|nr:hypothetical protein C8R45DRAFT_1072530 [Mycena sanguinolenta]